MADPKVAWKSDGVRLVLSTAPPDIAEDLARELVEERLAACVNLVPGLRSVFWWQGAVANDPETLLVAKTTKAGVEALARHLKRRHPYEVPEIVVVAPAGVEAAYAAWVQETVV
ncbi:MAG: divalent-cation tolerance protein CutA [Planctomycetota bacterium]